MLLVVLVAGSMMYACSDSSDTNPDPVPGGKVTIHGSGNIIDENRDVNNFYGLSILGSGRVIMEQGTEESLRIEADDNLLPYLETEVNGWGQVEKKGE